MNTIIYFKFLASHGSSTGRQLQRLNSDLEINTGSAEGCADGWSRHQGPRSTTDSPQVLPWLQTACVRQKGSCLAWNRKGQFWHYWRVDANGSVLLPWKQMPVTLQGPYDRTHCAPHRLLTLLGRTRAQLASVSIVSTWLLSFVPWVCPGERGILGGWSSNGGESAQVRPPCGLSQ